MSPLPRCPGSAGARPPQGRSSSLRCGRSTLTAPALRQFDSSHEEPGHKQDHTNQGVHGYRGTSGEGGGGGSKMPWWVTGCTRTSHCIASHKLRSWLGVLQRTPARRSPASPDTPAPAPPKSSTATSSAPSWKTAPSPWTRSSPAPHDQPNRRSVMPKIVRLPGRIRMRMNV
jgi:hypothetical protein